MKTFFLFCLLFFPAAARAEISVYFTPSSQCEDAIASRIDDARETLDIAVYAFNNEKIRDALLRARQRGVFIRFLTDKLQAAGGGSKTVELYDEGFDIRVHTKHRIEHNKFAVYDGKSVSTGSFNWTAPASKQNSENCLFVDDAPDVAAAYAARFEELWTLNTREKSDAAIAKIKQSRAEKAEKKRKRK